MRGIRGVVLLAGLLAGCGGVDADGVDGATSGVEQQSIQCFVDWSGYELCPVGMQCKNGICIADLAPGGEAEAQQEHQTDGADVEQSLSYTCDTSHRYEYYSDAMYTTMVGFEWCECGAQSNTWGRFTQYMVIKWDNTCW